MKPKKRPTIMSDTNVEHLEKRIGILFVEKGYVSPEQLLEGLKLQVKEDLETGKHRLLGRIFLEQGLITQHQLDDVLQTLWKKAKAETKGA